VYLIIRLISLIGYLLWRIWLWLWLIACLALLALVLLFPRLPEYRIEISQWLTIVLEQPVLIGKIDTFWSDGLPTIALYRIEFLDPQTNKNLADIAQLQVSFDVLESLYYWQLITKDASIKGSQLSLIHQVDGSIVLKGLPAIATTNTPIASTEPPLLLQWLLQQTHLSLHASTLTLLEPKQPPLNLTNLQVTIHTQGTEHLISGTTELPENVVQGVRGGQFNFDLLTTWHKARLLSVKGTFALQEAKFVSSALEKIATCTPPTCQRGVWGFLLPQMSGRIQASQQINGMWQVIVKDLLLKDQQQRWLLSEAKWYIIPTPHFFQIVGSASEIDLGKLLNWINDIAGDANPALRETIAALHLQGKLYDIRWQYVPHETNKWRFHSRFTDLGMINQGELPSIRDLSGEMDIAPQGGSLYFAQANLSVQANQLYTHPLALQKVNGTVRWEQAPDGWWVKIKDLQAIDLKNTLVKIQGNILFPAQSTIPQSDISIRLSQTSVTQVPYYVPDKILPDLYQWLNDAFISGHLNSVEMRLQGAINQLFDPKKPSFQLYAQVKNVTLDYAKGYPKLRQLNADITIKNNQLTITSAQGKIFDSQIQKVTTTIENLTSNNAILIVNGKIKGKAIDGLRYVKESPLDQTIKLDDLDIKGQISLQLDLQIPFSDKATKIKGEITFNDAKVRYKGINATLEQVNGQFNFTENGVFTKNLVGKAFDKSINLAIKTLTHAQPTRLQIQLTGQADRQFLTQQLPQLQANLADLPIYPRLSGTMDWQTTIEVVSTTPTKTTEIHFEADLTNMAIELPAPLNKSQKDKTILSFSTQLSDKNDYLRFRYGDIINGVFIFDQQGITKGTLLFGIELAQLTKNSGLRLMGHLPYFSLTEWLPLLPASNSDKKPLNLLLNLDVDNLILFDQSIKDVHLQTEYLESTLRFAITGDNIEGNIIYNNQQQPALLDIAFKHLLLKSPKKPAESTKSSVDPRTLPKVTFYCRDFNFENNKLGTINLETQPTKQGLTLKGTAKTKYSTLHLQGQWNQLPQQSQTQLTALLTSYNAAEMLKQFGFQKSPITAKSVEIQLQAHWQNAPYTVEFDKITGNLDILIKEGEIIDVDPGVGRLFGLFDLRSLPQRLSLDFRDIFNKGFAFTTLAGNFDVRAGHAYTDNTILQGPAAHIKFQGRTGLVAHDYEQTVTVIPHVSNAIPVAGALVGGLGIGAIALIIQALLESEIENAISYDYSITGSWEKPVITPLLRKIEPSKSLDGFPLSRHE